MFSLNSWLTNRSAEQRFLAPQIVQTSAMDCGPAALKCLLEGFDIPVSYGRLREACQTDVDGTSIDAIEDVAVQLGLEAVQTLSPLDHLLVPEADLLPALVITVHPNGLTHFVVAWHLHGPLIQIMDPAIGRRWLTGSRFLQEVFRHEAAIPAAQWREWAGSDGFMDPLRARLERLGLPVTASSELVDSALAESGWRAVAALDAATRLTRAVVESGGLDRGQEAAAVVARLFEQTQTDGNAAHEQIPPSFWSVLPAPSAANEEHSEEMVLMRGAVLVQVLGKRDTSALSEVSPVAESENGTDSAEIAPVASPVPAVSLSHDLLAALQEPPSEPELELLHALRADGLLTPAALLMALVAATAAVTWEAVLLRGLLELDQHAAQQEQRVAIWAFVFTFALLLLGAEVPIWSTVLRMGRRLEVRLRVALLEKIPRLGDRYFYSRLVSDMAQRAHDLRRFHNLPELGMRFLRAAFQLGLTTAGIIWLDPAAAPLTLLAVAISLGLALLSQPLLVEQDMRLRTHIGGLNRFYLDALLGLTPARTHSAEPSLRREHEALLAEWARASLGFYSTVTHMRTLSAGASLGLAIWIVWHYVNRGGEASGVLLLLYWVLNLPVLAQSVAEVAQQYPVQRNIVLRLLEPLGAPEEDEGASEWQDEGMKGATDGVSPSSPHPLTLSDHGVAIELKDITVVAGGHTILQEINLHVASGEHVAIVGSSGAGKSSLVGLLQGWHRAAQGELSVDGEPLDGMRLAALRRATAWVDPAVQIWNRSLLENLRYGAPDFDASGVHQAVANANLGDVLARLPDGLQTRLGEGGGLVSGGEGQRVRLGRALLRAGVRLAILDEPFRGLDREQRRNLLSAARQHWEGATLFCITHDVGETLDFGRVLIVEKGRIVEDGEPAELAGRASSRYCALLEAEATVQSGLWAGAQWRRLWLEEGKLHQARARRSPLLAIRGIGPARARRLQAAGIHSLQELARQTPERLLRAAAPSGGTQGVDAKAWIEEARQILDAAIRDGR